MKTTYYSVKTAIRKDKKRNDNTFPILVRVTKDRKTLKLSVKGKFIPIDNWDDETGRAKGKGFGILNQMLDRKEQDVKDYINMQQSIGNNPSLKEIQENWNGVKNVTDNFYSFFEEFCIVKFKDIEPSTQVHYNTLKKKLKAFKKDIKFEDINKTFIGRFKSHLTKTNSGVYNMIKFFKTVLKEAMELGFLQDTSWKRVKNVKPNIKNDFLTKKQLMVIIDCDLSERPELNDTRDKFLFACFTGLRFSDVNQLQIGNINNGVVKLKQQKTKSQVQFPLNEEALRIAKKYYGKKAEKDLLFRPLTNAATNRNLKKIALLAELDKHISFHLSRHTFASTLINNGIDSMLISKMMGHKKPLQTFNYMNTNISYMKESMAKVSFTQPKVA